ncbi:LysR family transcriptional regulator [Dialister sp.]|uniref:LysR family transcriptional regulator n=1 Tax=Dialister sp. TaxID=1955814 RepID=UPI003F0A111C
MDTSLYRSFVAIVETGNLSQAARKLHMAQPALTRHMKTLQEKYNTPLIQTARGRRHIELTTVGRIVYSKAKNILAMEDQLTEEIESAKSGVSGILRLTTSPSVAYPLIANTLAEFSTKNPNISFELIETSTEKQAENLLSGIAEIGIANAPIIDPEKFTIHLTVEDRMVLYVNEKSSVLKRFRIISNEKRLVTGLMPMIHQILETLPICLTKGCRNVDLKFLSAMGISKTPLCISTTVTAALQWAKENRAAVIAPIDDEGIGPQGLLGFLLPAGLISNFRIIYTVKGKKISRLAFHFLDYVMNNGEGESSPSKSSADSLMREEAASIIKRE